MDNRRSQIERLKLNHRAKEDKIQTYIFVIAVSFLLMFVLFPDISNSLNMYIISPDTAAISLGLIATTVSVLMYLYQNRPKKWSETSCEIISVNIEKEIRRGIWYFPKIWYEYTVEGKNYLSCNYRINQLGFESLSKAEILIDSYKVGERYKCFINPKNANQSVLVIKMSRLPIYIFFGGWVFPIIILIVQYYKHAG